jgi:hypothetical protein
MAYISFALTRPVPDEWQGLTQEENDAKTAAILEAVAKNGGDVKVTAFSGDHMALVSVIEYPDEMSGRKAVADVIALGTLEFVSHHSLWDLGEWTAMLREAQGG